ncbi:unnamed protein product [Cladocopium goreaui]|uniref:Glutathione hydrolase-like YwrD proenzyme (Putative gamma-glutamyltransferase YwrD) [Cleaved into: Glutathione hydrolase-like YwrD large chain Glutathione hydrolase-like YwrD small chain] n=1 Tax=Cladocopium goreaui TaxID=2562237 RepID=A0A9P1BW44_9DINO|nr:unnamed protein product [Cladocopium goreaui]
MPGLDAPPSHLVHPGRTYAADAKLCVRLRCMSPLFAPMEPGAFGFRSRRAPVYGARGMVATSQPLASEAGLRILQEGGTAADACVAAAAALNVTEPCNTGLGGDAFALFYEAKTKKESVGRTVDSLRGSELNPLSALCVTVPGSAAAWEAAIQRWGVKTLREVLTPAIELAEEGFPVSEGAAQIWKHSEDLLRRAAKGGSTPYLPDGRTPRAGKVFRNPDLARTMRLLGEKGAKEGFYTGRVAEEIVKALASRGGVMTVEDLAAHCSSFVEPISTCFRGKYRLYECPPPTQGVTALMALNLLEQVPVLPRLSTAAIHAQSEALRFAFADALQFCADPAAGAGVAGLLDKDRAAARWKQL